jgi:hypothetical protein
MGHCETAYASVTTAQLLQLPSAVSDPSPQVCEALPICPICGGKMELVYDRPNAKVCVCINCHTGISMPSKAWAIALARLAEKSSEPPG